MWFVDNVTTVLCLVGLQFDFKVASCVFNNLRIREDDDDGWSLEATAGRTLNKPKFPELKKGKQQKHPCVLILFLVLL